MKLGSNNALSRRAAAALEVLRSGGFFVSDPTYGGTFVSLHAAGRSQVVGFGHRGFAKAALRELSAAGYAIDEDMDGNNMIIGRLRLEPAAAQTAESA